MRIYHFPCQLLKFYVVKLIYCAMEGEVGRVRVLTKGTNFWDDNTVVFPIGLETKMN